MSLASYVITLYEQKFFADNTLLFFSVIQILAGKSKSKSPFDIDPGDALGGNVKTFSDLPFYMITAIVSSYKKFIIVRNPFERLFSGYIDKIFSLTFSHIGKHIVLTQRPNATHHSKQCGHDVTFAEFVKYFIQGERTKKHRDGHFIPMYDHCKPCQIGYDYIAKLETLEKDTIYILKQLNFSSMASSLEKGFKEKTKNDSAEDQTDLLFRYMKVLEKCISRHEIQKIFWRKEQIRGIIDPDIRFPFSEKESTSLTQEQYLDALHRSVGRTKSKEMAKKFRRDALLKAYSTIPKSDLEALKEIFKPDCEIFDYDCNSVQILNIFAQPENTFLEKYIFSKVLYKMYHAANNEKVKLHGAKRRVGFFQYFQFVYLLRNI